MEMLLEARPGPDPSGDDLEYDPDFMAMEMAAQPKPEQQIGSTIRPAEEPDHPETIRLALKVLERSHDLRAAIHLARARLRTGGLEGFAPVVAYIRACLETRWETCHPRLDADDDDDPTMRINTVQGLAAHDPTLLYLMSAPLAESRTFGRVSLRTIMIANGESPAPEGKEGPDAAGISASFRDTNVDLLRNRLEAVQSIHSDIAGINAIFDARTPGQGPDLDPLTRILRKIAAHLAEAVGEPEALPPAEDPSAPSASDGPPSGTNGQTARPAAPAGAIQSSADVRAALDRIITYYATYEPSSPLPILLKRARRLVGADFLTIMNDIAPDGVEAVRSIGGIKDEE